MRQRENYIEIQTISEYILAKKSTFVLFFTFKLTNLTLIYNFTIQTIIIAYEKYLQNWLKSDLNDRYKTYKRKSRTCKREY